MLAVVFLSAGVTAQAQYTIRWTNHAGATAVEVEGIPSEALTALAAAEPGAVIWSQLLAVYVEQTFEPGSAYMPMPPIPGGWTIAGGKLRFEPRSPLVHGVAYRAEFWPARLPGPLGISSQLLGQMQGSAPQGSGAVYSFFELPRDKNAPVTMVVRIFPSSDMLPENQSKFHVHFSGSMSRGGIQEHVQLRESSGKVVELPFRELDEEMWDPEMTRLTLLIDPGRNERGVKPLDDIGPVFEEGKTYTLSIKPSWRDAAGRPLRAGFEKTFRVGPADRTPPDPARWQVQYVPPAGAQGPLVVRFDEPLDRTLALRLIGVTRVNGTKLVPMDGDVVLDEQERRWMLQPVGPWPAGSYRLMVGSTIEDLAGNKIGKPFDVELASGVQRQLTAPSVSLPFEVK